MPKTVLVVEDDIGIREVAEFLEERGYTILTASHGAEAMEIVRSQHPVDVVLLDLAMPVMDGFAFASALLEVPDRKSTPVLAFSATHPKPTLAAPFVGFIAKPVNVEDLLAAIQRATSG